MMYDSETVLSDDGLVQVGSANLRQTARAGVDRQAWDWNSASVRVLDIVVSLAALIFFAPLLVFVSIAVYVTDPGPIFFAHRRIGRDGRAFACLKFRSMVVDAERRLAEVLSQNPQARLEWEQDHKLRKDPRITPIGAFLRRSSLDELPQLVNVLRGEMSVVGPRPIVEAEIIRYGRQFRMYCRVRPGITGLWQVSGRNNISYRRRVACDVLYARSKSFALDVAILARTLPAVLLAKGSY
jgi:lipopolysaccharide/colanic/teichoic acid biosynthesis glycosyltransferase